MSHALTHRQPKLTATMHLSLEIELEHPKLFFLIFFCICAESNEIDNDTTMHCWTRTPPIAEASVWSVPSLNQPSCWSTGLCQMTWFVGRIKYQHLQKITTSTFHITTSTRKTQSPIRQNAFQEDAAIPWGAEWGRRDWYQLWGYGGLLNGTSVPKVCNFELRYLHNIIQYWHRYEMFQLC